MRAALLSGLGSAIFGEAVAAAINAVPRALAATLKVMVQVAVWPPLAALVWSVAVTVYLVMAAPPSLAGGVKLTVAWVLPAVAVPIVGAPGAVAGGPLTVSVNDWLIDTALPVAAALMVK